MDPNRRNRRPAPSNTPQGHRAESPQQHGATSEVGYHGRLDPGRRCKAQIGTNTAMVITRDTITIVRPMVSELLVQFIGSDHTSLLS